MNKATIFWLLMILWAIFGIWAGWVWVRGEHYAPVGGSVLLFVLLALLGYRVFGSPMKD